MRRTRTVYRAAALVAVAAVAATPAVLPAEELSPQASGYQAEREPQQIYETTCGYCHGRNIGPIIKGRQLPAAAVSLFVRMGPNGMPAFRQSEITDAELERLAAWIEASEADPGEKGK